MKALAIKWITKLLLAKYQDKLLKWLGPNGWKTIIGVLVNLAAVLAAMATQADVSYVQTFVWAVDALKGIGGQVILSGPEIALLVSSLYTLVGLWHKIIKQLLKWSATS